MARSPFTFVLRPVRRGVAPQPLFVRVADAVSDAIRAGRLAPGDRLPGQRTVADALGLARDTVVAAWRELRAQGWIVVRASSGAVVAPTLPDDLPAFPAGRTGRGPGRRVPARPLVPPFPFRGETEGDADSLESAARGAPLDLARSLPDARAFPALAYARALRRQLRRGGGALLGYADPRGHAGLRGEIAGMLAARRGLAVGADDVLLVRGSQMGTDLLARALLRPGDLVVVEELGYRPARDALAASGADLLPLPVDAGGLDTDALRAIVRRRRVRAVHVTPHHQYPTTVSLAPERRIALLALAREHGFAVLEDDYDHEIHYEGRPIHPLAADDPEGHVLYVGTLSKTLAPALRIGYVTAPRAVLGTLAAIRRRTDRQGDTASEAAVADLFAEGVVRRHVRRLRRTCLARRDALVAALRRELPDRLSFRVPAGGMAVWAEVTDGTDADLLARRALARGVLLRTGAAFTTDRRPLPFLRLHFAGHTEDELADAVRRIAAAWPRRRGR